MNYRFVDLFCGGGGSISGAISALKEAGVRYEGRGFNHWETAIRTIQANHPEVVPNIDRACAPIESILPDEIFNVDPERINTVWASPSCTHHSNAAGGKPRSNQLRSQPEYLLPYLRLTKCRKLLVENVKELRDWGPILDRDTVYKGKLYRAGQPDPRKKGLFFNLWYREIKASGYNVDMAVLNAADYGAATSRERLIVQAVRKSSGCKIAWPEPTHMEDPGLLAGTYKPWRPASEIIDWSIKGESIFDRKKPLCPNTLRRIEAGIKKYWGAWAEPFLIVLRGTSESHINSSAVSLSAPLPTITTRGTQFDLIRPFLTRYNRGDDRNHSVEDPMPVIDCGNRYAVVEPFLVEYYGNGCVASCRDPLHTVTTKDRFGLIEGRILQLPDGSQYKLDITHRMFTMRELANATGFAHDYQFCGGDTAAKKQIGNAVPPDLAKALYLADLAA